MPYNGSGAFTRVYNWVSDAAAAIPITASRVDTEDDGFATGLSNAICRDGQSAITANLPMAGFRHTGVGNAVSRTDYPATGQIQDGGFVWIAAGGTADAITATYAPALTGLVDGMELKFRATAANATTTPTFSPNSLTARTITKNGGSALVAGDIAGNLAEYTVRYYAASTRWELLNPSNPNTLTAFSGMVVPYAGNSAPAGWLVCGGQAVSRTTFANLFTAIGIIYGAGDGTTTFNVPDLRGRSVFGLDNMGGSAANRVTNGVSGIDGVTRGAAGGDQNMHGHTHTATDSGHTHSTTVWGTNSINSTHSVYAGTDATSGVNSSLAGGSSTANVTNSTTGSGTSQNMPPTLIMTYIIKQ